MTNGAYVGGVAGGAAAAAVIAQAIKASGAIVRVEPHDFEEILRRSERPLVVSAQGGFISKNYQYLTGYKGLAFLYQEPDTFDPARCGGDCFSQEDMDSGIE